MEWYRDWAAKYCESFGLIGDDDLAMVASWGKVLTDLYREPELYFAADWLLANPQTFDPHRGRAERHLVALHSAIREIRAIAVRSHAKEEEGHEWGECTLCGSSGHVSVPRLEDVGNGEWHPTRSLPGARARYRTYVVACSCSLGRWKNQRRPPQPCLMALERYEVHNPCWREQLQARQAEQFAEARAHGRREGPLTRVMDRLIERFHTNQNRE